MTLIAAFRTKDGVAICADSQETVSHSDGHGGFYDLRETVQKIAPINLNGYQLVIAGSGDSSLIEGFIVRAKRRFATESDSANVDRALALLENELAIFYAHDVPSDQSMGLFIAVCCPAIKEYQVWVSQRHILKEVDDAQVIGWDHPLYKVTAARLYRKGMSLPQAILAAVYVLVVAEDSSNYVKGPFSLAVIRDNGIWMEDNNYADTLRSNLREFETYTSQILLACADSSIYSSALQAAIEKYANTARIIHEKHIDSIASQIFAQNPRTFMSSIPKLPPGILIELSDGKPKVRHDVNGIEEMSRRVNEALEKQRKEES